MAEGKCWDDSDNEKEEKFVNLALMARSDDEASSSSNQVPSLVLLDMSKTEYKQTIEELLLLCVCVCSFGWVCIICVCVSSK